MIHFLGLGVVRSLVSDVWGRLLVTLVVAEGSELVEVQGSVEVIEACLLLVWVILALDVEVNLHLGVSTVGESVQMTTLILDI